MILKLGIMQHLIKPKRDGGKMILLKRFQILLVFLMEICMLSGCNSMTTIDKDVDGETQEKTGTEIENHTEVLKQEGTEWFSSSEEIAELELPEDMLAYWLVLNSRQSLSVQMKDIRSFIGTNTTGVWEVLWDGIRQNVL